MCATSIGLTFSHSPFPGVRKSGIPDGTEIPAPVSATTESASRISDASSSVPCRLPTANCLLPLPLRRALAEEGADALLGVLGRKGLGEARLLRLDALVQVTLVCDLLDLLDGKRGLAGEPLGPRQRRVE